MKIYLLRQLTFMCINLLVICKYAANGIVSELIDANTHVVSLLQPTGVECSHTLHTFITLRREVACLL